MQHGLLAPLELPDEEWRLIDGFDCYEVSNLGRVKSYKSGQPRILKPSLDRGYNRVELQRRGQKAKSMKVYRLVIEAFVGPRPQGMECCHNNSISSDDRLVNLRWDTKINNIHDCIKANRFKGMHPLKLTEDQIFAIRASEQKNVDLAVKFGVSRDTIERIRNGKRWGWLKAST